VSSLLAAALPDVTDAAPPAGDPSRAWVEALGATGRAHDDAVARLHAQLLRAARFEVRRRRATLGGQVSRQELEDLATQAAGDAVVAILGKLDTFRGESRFTTWAYKFVLLEAAVKCRRRAVQDAARRPAQAARRDGAGRARPHRKGGIMMAYEELVVRLLGPGEEELSCEACFEQLDRYVDLELAGEDADAPVPGMRAHLRGCPACREDHESLRAFVEVDGGE
jgi:DNA-directed RNA polymerase specialized sigma24 family protein